MYKYISRITSSWPRYHQLKIFTTKSAWHWHFSFLVSGYCYFRIQTLFITDFNCHINFKLIWSLFESQNGSFHKNHNPLTVEYNLQLNFCFIIFFNESTFSFNSQDSILIELRNEIKDWLVNGIFFVVAKYNVDSKATLPNIWCFFSILTYYFLLQILWSFYCFPVAMAWLLWLWLQKWKRVEVIKIIFTTYLLWCCAFMDFSFFFLIFLHFFFFYKYFVLIIFSESHWFWFFMFIYGSMNALNLWM